MRDGRARSSASESDSGVLDQAVDLELPVGEVLVGEVEIVVVLRIGRAVGLEGRRDVGLGEFPREALGAEQQALRP